MQSEEPEILELRKGSDSGETTFYLRNLDPLPAATISEAVRHGTPRPGLHA